MKYNIENLQNKLNNIEKNNKIYNNEFKKIVEKISNIDITQNTKKLKYSLYQGKEKQYHIDNDKYKELISRFSDAYLSMSDFYVGPEIPKNIYFNQNTYLNNIPELYSLFIFFAIFEIYYNNALNIYDVD
jgi:hypothetical protein